MKVSKYNILVEDKGRFFVYNQLSGALTQVDKDLYDILGCPEKEIDPEQTGQDLLADLADSHFVCESDLTEENLILSLRKEMRYGRHTARITILPTVHCNFKCWYCYESHPESSMSEAKGEAVLRFIEQIINANHLNTFQLDWFGGEPLLYFSEIMYPIGLKVKKMCEDKGLHLSHTITTNGYLVDNDMAEKMNEMRLNSFQITLDGSAEFHNKTRFSKTDRQTYDRIVQNIILLCRKIESVNMTVRINYTPVNLQAIDQIAYSFPDDVKPKICIMPQLVWQFKDDINVITDIIKEKMEIFKREGFHMNNMLAPSFNKGCYVENMLQFVVNYDLSVYKCTARDFVNKKYSIGIINNEGMFIPNSNYYNYFVSSYMENPVCMNCRLLPSCAGTCIQKKVEGSSIKCPKVNIEQSLTNQIHMLINQI